MNNCLIIAGEKSGEEHCMTFYRELKTQVPDVHFWGVGGDELQSEGMELKYHLKDFNAWGISEVLKKLPYYIKALNYIEKEVIRTNTKVAILIDFQDFNLRLAQRLKKHGVEVLYYVAPTAWIWKEWRAEALSKAVHTLFTIYPFEKKFFEDRGVQRTIGVTHPLWMKYKDDLRCTELGVEQKPFVNLKTDGTIVLLPGSRRFEIKFLLPLFMEVIEELKKIYKIKVTIVKSSNVENELYAAYDHLFDNVYTDANISDALKNADLSMAASGTVTLTTALYELPTIVCYKLSWFNAMVYKMIVRYYGPVSMANIIHQEMVYPELLQNNATKTNLLDEIKKYFRDEKYYCATKEKLSRTRKMLQGESFDVADYISKVVCEKYEKDII
ncbi:MAG: lipid-A-disaccharide synthase [Bacteriovoracaceae bacterium]|nr:lipid-A-disaccharide synthase [Bacteriovoracaceae bacterium]